MEDLGEEGSLYKINCDNVYHQEYKRQQRDGVARDVVTEKYIFGMRILMLGCEQALRALQEKNGEDREDIADSADKFRRMAVCGAISTVLALAENLPKIVDRSSVDEDVEQSMLAGNLLENDSLVRVGSVRLVVEDVVGTLTS